MLSASFLALNNIQRSLLKLLVIPLSIAGEFRVSCHSSCNIFVGYSQSTNYFYYILSMYSVLLSLILYVNPAAANVLNLQDQSVNIMTLSSQVLLDSLANTALHASWLGGVVWADSGAQCGAWSKSCLHTWDHHWSSLSGLYHIDHIWMGAW